MRDTVDEVGEVVAAEGIDCDWVKGGTVALARTPAQLAPGPCAEPRLASAGATQAAALGAAPRRRAGRLVHAALRARSTPPGSSAGWRGPSSAAACDLEGTPRRGRAAPGA